MIKIKKNLLFPIVAVLFFCIFSSSLFASYQDALEAYYQGDYERAESELEGVSHRNRGLLSSLIQLKSNDARASETFSSANIPVLGPFEKIVRLLFVTTANTEEAVALRESIISDGRQPFVDQGNLELAKAYLLAGQLDSAEVVSSKLTGSVVRSVKRDARMIQIEVAISQGKQQRAELLYRSFIGDFPAGDSGFGLLAKLNKRFGTPYGVLDILQTRTRQMAYVSALYSQKLYFDFNVMGRDFSKRYSIGPDVEEVKKGLCVAAFESGNYDESVRLTREFISQYPRSSFGSTVHYYLARGIHRQKKYQEAKDQYDVFLSKYPNSEFVPAAYYYIYWACLELGTTDQFEQYLKAFKANHSNSVFYDKLIWELGWNAYLKQDYQTAYDILSKGNWKFDTGVAAKVAYWIAKSMDNIGSVKSQALFQQVMDDHPFTYYGYRVATQLFPERIGALSGRFKSTGVQIDPLYRTMLDSGLGEIAIADLDYKVHRLKDHSSKSVVTMAYLYSGMLQNHRAISLLTSLGFAINPHEPKISREIAQLLYPRPYWGFIQRHSKEYGVDPYLVVALMREESLFNSGAKSSVGALGLMQIMPATGKGIAKSLNVQWTGPEMLLVPHNNIRFGVFYLSGLQKRFDNNPILMLSGYNAGPNATGRWLNDHAKSGSYDMEQFVANIPYSETHFYVTRVLKSYWIYRLLYDPEFKAR